MATIYKQMAIHKKTVARQVPEPRALSEAVSARELLRQVPEIGFLFPKPKLHDRKRFSVVKRMFSKILGAIFPVMADQSPDTLESLITHER